MEQTYDFDEIRCYYDSDVPSVLGPLSENPNIEMFIKQVTPDIDMEQCRRMLKQMKTIDEFQRGIIVPSVMKLAAKTCDSLELNGTELINTHRAAIYMTNHRDIVLDSAFLNSLLVVKGFTAGEIAIGDNLLAYDWIRDLVRLNKSFIVKRDVPIRQMLDVSKRLSAYILHTITDKKVPVWIAQREGRSKDSSDDTQASVIKMLALSGSSRSFVENIRPLNLQPVAISYEFDPCDYLKCREFQLKRDNANYKKAPGEDINSMSTGLMGYKGRVVLTITPELNLVLETLPADLDRNAQISAICTAVDRAIHSHMVLFPINYLAYDLRFGGDKYASQYTEEEKTKAYDYLKLQLSKIDVPNKDEAFLWEKLLLMYSNPVVNKENL